MRAEFLWRDLKDSLVNAFASADRAYVVSPYVQLKPLEALLEAVPVGVPLTVITRWHPADVASGATDPRIVHLREGRQALRILVHPDVHAKVYVCTDTCFVGSANLSATGLALGCVGNTEVLVRLTPVPTQTRVFLRILERRSIEPSVELAETVIENVAQRGVRSSDAANIEFPGDEELAFLPATRAPDKLYSGYRQLIDVRPGLHDAILDDLAELRCPAGLTKEGFELSVRSVIRKSPISGALYTYAARPRRFGEITAWLKRRWPDDPRLRSHEDRQRIAQVLLRWLLYFDPTAFTLEQPGHTEVLSRR